MVTDLLVGIGFGNGIGIGLAATLCFEREAHCTEKLTVTR
jgi:hypothetical protein